MDRQQIGVKLAIDGLNLPFKIDGFQDRLIMQKSVYLAQTAGVNLGYYYHWYLHGPYSPSLTRDEYAIAMDISADMYESEGWKLDGSSSEQLERIRDLFAEPDRDKLAKKLELLASAHFLINTRQVSGNNAEQITATLKRFDKPFSEKDVQNALEELISYGLLTE